MKTETAGTRRRTLPRSQIRVLLLEGVHERAAEYLSAMGYTNVRHEPDALPQVELRDALSSAHVVGIRSRTQLDAEALATARRLFAVGCFCIGTNQVDLSAAAHKGVPVFNAPHSNTRSVAELVIGLSVMLMRGIFEKSTRVHEGGWLKTAAGSHELRGRTLGIVGYGHIGSQVSVLAEAMGMHVVFHDIRPVLALGNARPQPDLASVLQIADIVTLHVPDTPETRGLIGKAELDAMRPGSHLINASRGTVVDGDALAAALVSGHVAGAAVDVFEKEPKGKDETFENPLRGIPSAILTPHVGGSTLEAQEAIAIDVATKLVSYSDSGNTTGAVNFPQLNLTAHEGCHRVLHIHRNAPGIMAHINEVLSSHGANILGQHLQTLGDIGYVVIDVDSIDAAEALPQLKGVEGTLRTRILY